MISLDQLNKIIPYAGHRAGVFLVPLNEAMEEFGILTPNREAAFVAQIAHESCSLHCMCELASGSGYEGRVDLGNTEQGDGVRYKGRGLIQITGRANYASCSAVLYGDPETLQAHPEILEGTVAACRSAAWWWQAHGLNELADACEFTRITKRINGGLNGQPERLAFYTTALQELV